MYSEFTDKCDNCEVNYAVKDGLCGSCLLHITCQGCGWEGDDVAGIIDHETGYIGLFCHDCREERRL